jgi:acyl carrier protein
MTATNDEIQAAVKEAVVAALGVDDDEVTPDATLLGDLGAESIDLLDILFRLERKLGIKIQASDLGAYVQGGIPDEEFGNEAGIVGPTGLAHLQKVMPQLNTDELAGKLEAGKVMSLFTVQNLVSMVAERAATKVT